MQWIFVLGMNLGWSKYLIYWIFGLIFWVIWMLKYAFDHVIFVGDYIPYNAYNVVMALLIIPYIAGLIIYYFYSRLYKKKVVWSIGNQIKFWIFGIIIPVTWYVFVFALEPFLPNWWNNTYTAIFFATLPSFIGGLVVGFVLNKWVD